MTGLLVLVFPFNLANLLKEANKGKLPPKKAKQLFPTERESVHNIESKEPTLCTAQDEGVVCKRKTFLLLHSTTSRI